VDFHIIGHLGSNHPAILDGLLRPCLLDFRDHCWHQIAAQQVSPRPHLLGLGKIIKHARRSTANNRGSTVSLCVGLHGTRGQTREDAGPWRSTLVALVAVGRGDNLTVGHINNARAVADNPYQMRRRGAASRAEAIDQVTNR